MSELADRHAHPDGTAERLGDAERAALLAEVPQWDLSDGRLRREVKRSNFAAALSLVNQIGGLAEEENHHPDILLHGWNRVRFELYTHTAQGITENDLIMAAKFDRILDD